MRPGNQESGTMKNLETIHLNISLPASRVPQNKDCEGGANSDVERWGRAISDATNWNAELDIKS